MATIILRILLLAIFVAHFAMPENNTTVTLESAPFTDCTQTAGIFSTGIKG